MSSIDRQHPRPWHRESVFGDGPRHPLNREERARFRYLLKCYRAARRITRATYDLGMALRERLSEATGQCDPSHATLANDVDCSERTVRRRLADLKQLGLIRWVTRVVRVGWRTEQTSNAYELLPTLVIPPNPPLRRKADRCGGQNVRETKTFIDSRLKEGSDQWALWNRDRQLAVLRGEQP